MFYLDLSMLQGDKKRIISLPGSFDKLRMTNWLVIARRYDEAIQAIERN